MMAMRVYRIWPEEGRKPTDQPRRTIERQELALQNRFATTRHAGDQRFEEDRPVGMRTLYRRIQAYGPVLYHPRLGASTSFGNRT